MTLLPIGNAHNNSVHGGHMRMENPSTAKVWIMVPPPLILSSFHLHSILLPHGNLNHVPETEKPSYPRRTLPPNQDGNTRHNDLPLPNTI